MFVLEMFSASRVPQEILAIRLESFISLNMFPNTFMFAEMKCIDYCNFDAMVNSQKTVSTTLQKNTALG